MGKHAYEAILLGLIKVSARGLSSRFANLKPVKGLQKMATILGTMSHIRLHREVPPPPVCHLECDECSSFLHWKFVDYDHIDDFLEFSYKCTNIYQVDGDEWECQGRAKVLCEIR